MQLNWKIFANLIVYCLLALTTQILGWITIEDQYLYAFDNECQFTMQKSISCQKNHLKFEQTCPYLNDQTCKEISSALTLLQVSLVLPLSIKGYIFLIAFCSYISESYEKGMKFASVCLIVCNFTCTITTIVGYIEIYQLDVDQITMNRTILHIYLCIGILSFLKFIMNVLLFREIKRIIFVKIEAIPIVPIFGAIESEQIKTKIDDQKNDDLNNRNQLFYMINLKQEVNQIELIDGIPVGIALKQINQNN